jgi:hypothetical protein
MKYNKPKYIKKQRTRFIPPEGNSPFKEVYNAQYESPFKEEEYKTKKV